MVGMICLLPIKNTLAFDLKQCPSSNQEIFGFKIENYAWEHQGYAMLDIAVNFRYIYLQKIEPETYVDFIPMVAEIERFLTEYPNEEDYWEIVNRQLAEFLLEQYPTISSIRIKMFVDKGSGTEYFDRWSIVSLTREGECSLTY